MSTAALERTGRALGAAGREIRAGWTLRTTLTVLAIAAALIAPSVLPLSGRMPDLAAFVYLAVAAVGLAYAVGLAGIPSLGQGAFLGVGAFTEAVARAKGGWPLLPSLLLAVVAAAAAGGLTGLATGRLRGAFVAASTWILSWIVVLALTSFPGISGGAQGLVLPEATVLGRTLTPTAHYEIGIALLTLAIVAFAVVARRGPGLALAAAREQPGPALALGVPVARLRLGAFAVSAAIAGLAGALGVELAQVADPSGYGPVLSFKLFVAVIVGGAWTPLGPVAGLLVISVFSHAAEQVGALRGLPPGRLQEMLTGYGLLLVLGLGGAGLLPTVRDWWARRAGSSPDSLPPAHVEPLTSVKSARPLAARGLSKRFESLLALDDLDLDLRPGAVHALIGPNGSGKTTALKALSGELRPDSGSIALGDDPLEAANQRERARRGVVGTQQTTARFPDLTVLQHTLVGAGLRRRRSGPFRTLFRTPQARADEAKAEGRALGALELVGLLQDRNRPAAELSAHGQRLLMLASALATEPRVLLLDEPAAGASSTELDRLVDLLQTLRSKGLALLLIEHNLRFVRRVADEVTVLEAGRRIASGTLAEVAANEAVRIAYLGRQA
jgi:ABC-type branched-subunit amino acid transport system ATPase component/ABC-type branched-subunit amino acid transport system permease subunit